MVSRDTAERLSDMELVTYGDMSKGIKGLVQYTADHEKDIRDFKTKERVKDGQIKLLRWVLGAVGLNTIIDVASKFMS